MAVNGVGWTSLERFSRGVRGRACLLGLMWILSNPWDRESRPSLPVAVTGGLYEI